MRSKDYRVSTIISAFLQARLGRERNYEDIGSETRLHWNISKLLGRALLDRLNLSPINKSQTGPMRISVNSMMEARLGRPASHQYLNFASPQHPENYTVPIVGELSSWFLLESRSSMSFM